jgi:hypothetical protein
LIKRRKSRRRNIALSEIPEVRGLQRQTRVGTPPVDVAVQGLKLRAAPTYLPITFHGKRFWPTLVTRAWEEVRCASLTGLHVSDSVEGRRPAIDSIV